jgi:ribonucleoside-diphosphate reductase alpha chain
MQEFSNVICGLKYANADLGEKTRDDVINRIAEKFKERSKEFSIKSPKLADMEESVLYALKLNKFWGGGRIMANWGTPNSRTCLVNCTGLGKIEDSMDGIMEALTDCSKLLQSGAGVGGNFSPIRYNGAKVVGVGGEASGPISFMKVFSTSCSTIKSSGSRRGALIGILDVRHPDIMEFICCKDIRGMLDQFNISVGVTEGFMDAVEKDLDWNLCFPVDSDNVIKTMKAREIWEAIQKHGYDHAEPGILFLDTANKYSTTHFHERIEQCNP